jgi:hypothetical protein
MTIKKGKIVEFPTEGEWVKKKPQEFTEGPNLRARRVDGDVVECDVIFWPRMKKEDLEI